MQVVRQLGTHAAAIAVDAANTTFLAGRFTSPGYFGPTNTLASAGLNDAFIARIGVLGPGISAGPVSRTVVAGSNAVLSVSATGTDCWPTTSLRPST